MSVGRPGRAARQAASRDRRHLLVAPTGVSVLLSSLGSSIVELHAPDRLGKFADIVLGFDTADAYRLHGNLFIGATIGRVANRIGDGRFDLDGRRVQLSLNDGTNHLHGGSVRPFHLVDWASEVVSTTGGPAVVFRHSSPDGEGGYPGRLDVTVMYTLGPDNDLRIEYEATADARTPVSLTNHTYWNLAGHDGGSILDHQLEIAASAYTPTRDDLIPTGEIAPVSGTALDFRAARAIGERIGEVDGPGTFGYDHNLVLDGSRSGDSPAARLRDPRSGRMLELSTTLPCLQLYSGNFLRPTRGKTGAQYGYRMGLCLEPQQAPDAVNHPEFAPVIVSPGRPYRASIGLRIGREAGAAGLPRA